MPGAFAAPLVLCSPSLNPINSEAVANGNYHQKIKSILTANGDGPKKPANSTITATASEPSASAAKSKSKSSSSHNAGAAESSDTDKSSTKADSPKTQDEKAASRVNSRFFRNN